MPPNETSMKVPESLRGSRCFYGQFHFEPWVKIKSLAQVYDLIGTSPWMQIEITHEQLKDFAYLLLPNKDLPTEINGVPIVIYGTTEESSPTPTVGNPDGLR